MTDAKQEWRTDMDAARRFTGKMFVGLWVQHGYSENGVRKTSQEWDVELVWIDEDTGEIDIECSAGWDLADYEAWVPVNLPPPPVGMPTHSVESIEPA